MMRPRTVALSFAMLLLPAASCVSNTVAVPSHNARTTPSASTPIAASSSAAASQLQPPAVPLRDLRLPSIAQRRTVGGLDVWHVDDPSVPIVHLRLVVDAGSSEDGAKSGLAKLTAMSLVHGAGASAGEGKVSPLLVDRMRVEVTRDAAIFSFDVLDRELHDALMVLGAMTSHPAFRQIDGDAAKREFVAQVTSHARAPLAEVVRDAAVGQGEAVSPDAKAIAGIDVQSFYRTHYGSKRARLIVVGKAELDKVVQEAEAAFGAWAGPAPRAAEEPASPSRRLVLLDTPVGVEERSAWGAALTPGFDDPAWPAIWLAAAIAATEAHLATGESFGQSPVPLVSTGRPALLLIGGNATAENQAKMAENFTASLQRLATAPPSNDTMLAARKLLLDAIAVRTHSQEALAATLTAIAQTGASPAFLGEVSAKLRAVSPTEVTAAVRSLLGPERWTLVFVGPAQELRAPLGKFGSWSERPLPGAPPSASVPLPDLPPR